MRDLHRYGTAWAAAARHDPCCAIAPMVSRRAVLARLSMWASLLLSYGTGISCALRFLYPPRREAQTRSIYVGRLSDLPDGGSGAVEDLRGAPLLLLRRGERVLALSRTCPHLGCMVHWEGDKERFLCPCHNGVFDSEGRVVSGPPPRALERYDVEILDDSVYVKMKEPAGS